MAETPVRGPVGWRKRLGWNAFHAKEWPFWPAWRRVAAGTGDWPPPVPASV